VRPHGKRFIAAEGHIRMMAAAQPFISGAISKTINMPNEATVDDVKQAYELAGADAQGQRALPRRLQAQPAAQLGDDGRRSRRRWTRWQPTTPRRAGADTGRRGRRAHRAPLHLAKRRRLPNRRAGYTQKAVIGGHKVYLRTGEYEDGTLGEIFLDMHKEGAAFRS
jgi:ribonucleoside-diphosphate reductase alpha chain